jgi:hypothetical protein
MTAFGDTHMPYDMAADKRLASRDNTNGRRLTSRERFAATAARNGFETENQGLGDALSRILEEEGAISVLSVKNTMGAIAVLTVKNTMGTKYSKFRAISVLTVKNTMGTKYSKFQNKRSDSQYASFKIRFKMSTFRYHIRCISVSSRSFWK